MSEAVNLPVVPLRGAVLFPGVSIPIAAGRPGTLRAIEAAANAPGSLVFAVAQRQSSEKVSPDLLYTIGTVASIVVDFGVPVYFCSDRQAACRFVEEYLTRFHRRIARCQKEMRVTRRDSGEE